MSELSWHISRDNFIRFIYESYYWIYAVWLLHIWTVVTMSCTNQQSLVVVLQWRCDVPCHILTVVWSRQMWLYITIQCRSNLFAALYYHKLSITITYDIIINSIRHGCLECSCLVKIEMIKLFYDGMAWVRFLHSWPFVRVIYRSPMDLLHRGSLMSFVVVCVIIPSGRCWTNSWVICDFRCHDAYVVYMSLCNRFHGNVAPRKCIPI